MVYQIIFIACLKSATITMSSSENTILYSTCIGWSSMYLYECVFSPKRSLILNSWRHLLAINVLSKQRRGLMHKWDKSFLYRLHKISIHNFRVHVQIVHTYKSSFHSMHTIYMYILSLFSNRRHNLRSMTSFHSWDLSDIFETHLLDRGHFVVPAVDQT